MKFQKQNLLSDHQNSYSSAEKKPPMHASYGAFEKTGGHDCRGLERGGQLPALFGHIKRKKKRVKTRVELNIEFMIFQITLDLGSPPSLKSPLLGRLQLVLTPPFDFALEPP